MPQPFDVKMSHALSSESWHHTGEFSDEEWQRLVRFEQFARELAQTRFYREGMPSSFSFGWNDQGEFHSNSTPPDPDDLSAFLMRIRPFYLEKEGAFFNGICNILSRRVEIPPFRDFIRKQKEIFACKRQRSMYEIQLNGTVLNSSDILDKWLNAFEFHRDEEKRREIEELSQILPLESSKAMFVEMLFEMTEAILTVSRLIEGLRLRNGMVMKTRELSTEEEMGLLDEHA
jgi:hypothetical protein